MEDSSNLEITHIAQFVCLWPCIAVGDDADDAGNAQDAPDVGYAGDAGNADDADDCLPTPRLVPASMGNFLPTHVCPSVSSRIFCIFPAAPLFA